MPVIRSTCVARSSSVEAALHTSAKTVGGDKGGGGAGGGDGGGGGPGGGGKGGGDAGGGGEGGGGGGEGGGGGGGRVRQFMLGADLMVLPVLAPGVASVRGCFPRHTLLYLLTCLVTYFLAYLLACLLT